MKSKCAILALAGAVLLGCTGCGAPAGSLTPSRRPFLVEVTPTSVPTPTPPPVSVPTPTEASISTPEPTPTAQVPPPTPPVADTPEPTLSTDYAHLFAGTYWGLSLSSGAGGYYSCLFLSDGTYRGIRGTDYTERTGTWKCEKGLLYIDGEAYEQAGDEFVSLDSRAVMGASEWRFSLKADPECRYRTLKAESQAAATPEPTPVSGLEKIKIGGWEYSRDVTEIDNRGFELTNEDLVAMKQFPNLQTFQTLAGTVDDLSPLAEMPSLKTFILYESRVSDLTPIAGATNLTGFDLGYNQISDLTPLAGLTNLTWLSLSDNQISDLTPLEGLKNLEVLNLMSNEITDPTPLMKLTNLESLYLSYGNEISPQDLARLQEALPNCKIS